MDQGVSGRDGEDGHGAAVPPLVDVLALLEASVEALCAVDWSAHGADALADAVGRIEVLARRLEAGNCRATAELAGLHAQKGRTPGGVAAMLAQKLGLARGTVHGRIEAGGRQATPAGRASASGQITGEHERIIAKAVSSLPGAMGGEAKIAFAEELTRFARSASPADLRAEAARRVAELCPARGRDREEHQERQRSARLGAVRADGTSTLTMTLTPRGRALVERALCDFGGPGGAVACEPGSDDRAPEQRAHDALVHQWALGSTVDPARPKGVATIVVRLTPEQLEDPHAVVETDSGTQLSVRQAVSMAGTMPWFVSLLRDGREELHRIDVDAHPERRIASAIQRLVLYAAHGGCTFPGCTTPARRSQFHHVREWSRGGPTTIANGALGCPVHHGFVGDGPAGWTTIADPATPGSCTWLPPGVDRLTDV
ncbi:DUF222 domain-containing protein [Dietzia sp. CH92]|uniref:HNH endonuclease signature motif containing protein n=1 Tax=Dietzia sp. CH92 TaxID=3051823 RepID=UPI0028D2E5AE|nr:DUF222 domain-containing protein [Dietzia sp. CH92]